MMFSKIHSYKQCKWYLSKSLIPKHVFFLPPVLPPNIQTKKAMYFKFVAFILASAKLTSNILKKMFETSECWGKGPDKLTFKATSDILKIPEILYTEK